MLDEYFHHSKDSIKNDNIQTLKIGLDISINSTGLVIDADNEIFLYLIVPKEPVTVKGLPTVKFSHSAEYLVYEQFERTKKKKNKIINGIDHNQDELNKIKMFDSIIETIINKISEFNLADDCEITVSAETPSYSSTGRSAIDIPQINILTRLAVRNHFKGYDNLTIRSCSPKRLKSLFTDNGNAGKKEMVDEFVKYVKIHVTKNPDYVGDLADAFALTHVENI